MLATEQCLHSVKAAFTSHIDATKSGLGVGRRFGGNRHEAELTSVTNGTSHTIQHNGQQ